MKLGLIGVGAWGRRYADRIAARSDCRIAAVARASSAHSDAVPGAAQCESWQALVAQAAAGELDGVIAATSPVHQAEVAAACAGQGVPLLVEKPLGLSRADVQRVQSAFEAAPRKAPLIVDYIHLWSAAFRRLQQLVSEAGGPGSVVAIETAGFKHGPVRDYSSLYDYGPHDVAMALMLLGVDAEFRLDEVDRRRAADGCELYVARFDLGGVPARMTVGNGGDHKSRRFDVELRGGRTIAYDDTREHPLKLVEGGAPIEIKAGGPLDAVIGDFVGQLAHWDAAHWVEDRARKILHLSARVNAILDEIAARAERGAT